MVTYKSLYFVFVHNHGSRNNKLYYIGTYLCAVVFIAICFKLDIWKDDPKKIKVNIVSEWIWICKFEMP